MTHSVVLAEHVGASDGWAVLSPEVTPFCIGNAPSGVDAACIRCGTQLTRDLYPRQLLDLVIRCTSCGTLLASPVRQPGEPIAGAPVLCPPGTYRLADALDFVDKPTMVVGEGAVRSYYRETGRSTGVLDPRHDERPTELSPLLLRGIANALTDLLGQRYDAIAQSDARALRSPTPPRRRHRIAELIDFAETSARLLETKGRSAVVNGDLLAELILFDSMLRRWQNHPQYQGLVNSLASATEPQHTAVLLVTAAHLVDANNGVGIYPGDGPGARPDIWIEPSLSERVELEVKTPSLLRGPADIASADVARRLVRTALKKAGRQFSPQTTGVLVLGGYHMAPQLDVLEQGAKAALRDFGRRQNLAGVLLVNVSYVQEGPGRAIFTPAVQFRLAKHANYRGGLQIVESQPPEPYGLLPEQSPR